ncbi:hypothetical protein CV093_05180 [Oceanobacillus sp. 143]|uniref:Uncharacterized protein n=1 Tax=Oceanobacillus zhaokaii TaxID=2052660 RepID=A0A345PE81_9BACI|nr:hypothetical protein [Oceanobacillus zhaokaii]AXI08311.1 hypothetical protein CUC15_04910 [Oceanobacillus zhaokaii]QGS68231.1 hypothetical protein CV093_05180 [Oceanobacillus sp. 143]
MQKQTYKLFVIALFTSFLILVGCTEKTETKIQNENIETVEAVLQNAFTGPDDEFKKAFNSDTDIEDLAQYEEKLYKDYFANGEAFVEFIMSYGSGMMIEAIKNDYSIKVKNIEYEKTESKEIIYDFTAEIQYQKEGNESSEIETVTGQANLNEEHKIEVMLIRGEDLLATLNN